MEKIEKYNMEFSYVIFRVAKLIFQISTTLIVNCGTRGGGRGLQYSDT